MSRQLLSSPQLVVQDIQIVGQSNGYTLSDTLDESVHEVSLTSETSHLEQDATISGDKLDSTSQSTGKAVLTPSSSASDTVAVVATVSEEVCMRFCPCTCHSQFKICTPNWFHHYFGSFQFRSNSTFLFRRKECNLKKICRQRGSPTTQITYFAPGWAYGRCFFFWGINKDIGPIEMHFATGHPRWIEPDSRIWSLISEGTVEEVRSRVEKGHASLFDVDEDGESLLHYAGRFHRPDMCDMLIKLGANKMARGRNGIPAYEVGLDHVFANPEWSRNLEPEVIDHFADIYAKDEMFEDLDLTPIHKSVLGLVGTPLETQINLSKEYINVKDAGGRTAFMWATRRGDLSSMELLIRYEADIHATDIYNVSALHKAVADANDECVKLLLENGADPNHREDSGSQPLHNICFTTHRREASIQALIERGADINGKCNNGATSLSWCVGFDNPNSLHNMKCLIECGADVDTVNNRGDSPVMLAVSFNRSHFVRYLVDVGSNLQLQRKNGSHILHLAASCAGPEVWEILREAAKDGRMKNLSLKTLHVDHDVIGCFEHCRDVFFIGDRGDRKLEKKKFMELLAAVEEHSIEE